LEQTKNLMLKTILTGYIILTLTGLATAQDWEVVDFPLNESITGISFVHPDTGHLVTSGGKHARTFDGGKHWWGRQITTGHSLEDVHFIDGMVGVVCGRNRAIHLTNDGGDSWREVSWPDTTIALISIRMLDSLTMLTVGLSSTDQGIPEGFALRSDDGGQTWKKVDLHGNALGELFCDSDGTAYCLSLGYINYSVDRGKTWRSRKSDNGLPGRLLTMHGDHGIMIGNHGMCAYTENRGKTWRVVDLQDEQRHFITAVLVNDSVGYIAGTLGSIYRTSDGGRSWKRELMAKSFDVYGLCAIGDWVWAVGTDGGIIRKRLR
jgi:photosystem II stability/assembly factor-like uncharacterized protein